MNRAYSTLEIKRSSEEQRTIEGYCSTPATDLAGDEVMPLGMKTVSDHIPFLWQHSPDAPIGKVVDLRPTAKGVLFKAQLAKVTEAGVLKDRLDECWQSIREGLVRGISIGFIGKDWEPMPGGGRRFKTWILNEISAVTIPCNQECSISTVKRYANEKPSSHRVVRLGDNLPAMAKSNHIVRIADPVTTAVASAAISYTGKSASQMLAYATSVGFKTTDECLDQLHQRISALEQAGEK